MASDATHAEGVGDARGSAPLERQGTAFLCGTHQKDILSHLLCLCAYCQYVCCQHSLTLEAVPRNKKEVYSERGCADAYPLFRSWASGRAIVKCTALEDRVP